MCTKSMVIALLSVGCLGWVPATATAQCFQIPGTYWNVCLTRPQNNGFPIPPAPPVMPQWDFGTNGYFQPFGGYQVMYVAPYSPAARAGIVAGNVILFVNGQPLWNDFDYDRLIRRSPNRFVNLQFRDVWGVNRFISADLLW